MNFGWTPNRAKLSTVFGLTPSQPGYDEKIRRKFRDCSIKERPVPMVRLKGEVPALKQIALDLF